jgi:PAS domain S-box-containing protein
MTSDQTNPGEPRLDARRPRRPLRRRVASWLLRAARALGGADVDPDAANERRHASLRARQSDILGAMAADTDLPTVLDAICRLVEDMHPGMPCSILLLADGCLRRGAAPSLPAEYVDAIDGTRIGTMVGACGTACATRRRVMTEDIELDPKWAAFAPLARRHGLRACWSQPILDADGSVLGAFAMYYRTARLPTSAELLCVEEFAHVVALAIARRRATESSEQVQERLEWALAGGGLGAWDWRPQQGTLFVDERWANTIGERVSDLSPAIETWNQRVHEDDLSRVLGHVEDHLNGRTSSYECEYRLRHRDGSWRWVLDRGRVVARDADGKPTRVVGVHSDVTERKRVEQRLAESEWRARTLIEGTDVILWEFDPLLERFTYVSPQAERLGYPLDAWREPNFWPRILHPDDREQTVDYCLTATSRGEDHRMQYRMLAADGRVVWFDDLVRVVARPGSPPLLRGVLIDMTSAKQMEIELQQARVAAEAASEAKSAFLANMSHEIRTPLTAILGYADLLCDEADGSEPPERRAEIHATIRSAGRHLMTVVNDILDLSKIEAGRLVIEHVPTDLTRILDEVVELVAPQAEAKGIAFAVRIEPGCPERLRSDPTRLRQIVLNLASNAVKFTEIGSVTVTARVARKTDGVRLQIDVEDTGVGLSETQANWLFRPFVQADSSVTRTHGGTGLGLTIGRRLATLMGGDVILVRSAPGDGACFRIELPLVAMAGERRRKPKPAAAADASPRRLRGRILLAEDGVENQRLISYLLSRAGADVAFAKNGRLALEMIEQADAEGRSYDLLLSDMQMPVLDGYSLARQLRANGSRLPIVALTAHAMSEDRAKCLAAGVDDYATKPIDREHLIATCAHWIGRRSTFDGRRFGDGDQTP